MAAVSVVYFVVLVVVLAVNGNEQVHVKAGAFPFSQSSVGEGLPVPLPKTWTKSSTVLAVRNEGFVFNATGMNCDDLEAAFDRYYKIIFDTPMGSKFSRKKNAGFLPRNHVRDSTEINGLDVYVHEDCSGKPRPFLGMDEHYKLQITSGKAMLSAGTLWGALRGLETFSQLVYETQYESHGIWLVNETMIDDGPRFQHRGFLVDTSRHFIEKNILLQFISALSMAKYNIFHWHIVDDQSFPYRSRVFPETSQKGAYEPYTHVYDHEDIAEVVEYARQRGIRVIAEFDTPGHTLSWGPGNPGLLTPCYGKDGKPDGTYGPIDPSKNSTYTFLEKLFTEVAGVFPDSYIHLGGDEVSFNCWKSNPDINAFMATVGIKQGDYSALESYYFTKVIQLVSNIGKSYVTWQEPFDNGVKLAKDTVVNVWKYANPDPVQDIASVTKAGYTAITSACWYLNRIAYGENWHSYYQCDPTLAQNTVVNVWKAVAGRTADQETAAVTNAGFQAITSACWYLNVISYGEDWHKYYQCDPQRFNGTDSQKDLVLGGEGCMWAEYVDGTNLMSRSWPRAAVVAERLWSPSSATDLNSMKERLEVHRCRMLKRRLDANPEDPSYCRYEKQSLPPMY